MPTHLPDIHPTVFLKTAILRQGPTTFRIVKGHLFGPQGAELADLSKSMWLAPAFQASARESLETGAAGAEEDNAVVETGIRSLAAEIRTEPTQHGGPQQGSGFWVSVEGTCDRTLACVRCLCSFHLPITLSDRIFAPDPTGSRQSEQADLKHRSGHLRDTEVQLEAQDLDVYELAPQGLAIDEVLLDLIEGETPDYPVCVESCLGLCQECGTSLNDGNCGGQRENCPILQAGGLQ